MSIFERLLRIGKSNVNAAVDKLEDPVKIIDQVLRELDEDIEKVTSATVSQMAVVKRFERELEEAEAMVADRDEKARQALARGLEDLAREALVDKAKHAEKRDTVKAGYDRAKETSDKLRVQLDDLKARITEMKDKRSTLIAQAEAAKTQQKINSTLSGLGRNDAGATFARMEENIKKMHDEADAAYELANGDKSLDEKFEELLKDSKNSKIDDELAALKAEMDKNK